MKKQLVAFPAILAVGMLAGSVTALAQKKASKPVLSVGGYSENGMKYVDNGDGIGGKNTGGLHQFNDAEVHFNFNHKLDNGMSIVGRFELEGTALDDGDATQMDEQWLALRGSFGQVILGNRDNAAMLMVTGYQGSWAAGAAHSFSFERNEIIPSPAGFTVAGPTFGAREDLSDADANKITYVSPRMGGFQIGGSYARDTGQSNPDASPDQSTGTGFEDFIAIAANFDKKFGNFRFGIAAGYLQDSPAVGNTATRSEREAWVGGVSLQTGPFKVAFGVNFNDDPTVGTSTDGEVFDIGARYTTGPHKISVAYTTAQVKGSTTTAGDDEVDAFWASHSYAVAPGVAWRTSVGWADFDGEGTATTADNDGFGVMTSVRISF